MAIKTDKYPQKNIRQQLIRMSTYIQTWKDIKIIKYAETQR